MSLPPSTRWLKPIVVLTLLALVVLLAAAAVLLPDPAQRDNALKLVELLLKLVPQTSP